jgi:hypothetical protein
MSDCEDLSRQNSLIIDSFQEFVVENELISKNDLPLLFDDIISSYIINTIKQLYEEYESHKIWLDCAIEETFDIENFIEIIDEYISGFMYIDRSKVVTWLKKLKQNINELATTKENDDDNNSFNKRNESSNDTLITRKDDSLLKSSNQDNDQKNQPKNLDLQLLCDIFPSLSLTIISKSYKKANSDYNKAIDELLMIQTESQNEQSKNNEETIKLSKEQQKLIKEYTVKK